MAFESTIQNSEHNCEMVPSCISVSGRSAMALQIKVGNCDVTVQHSVHCSRAHWLNNCLESCRSYISLALVIISAERCKRKARVIIWHNGTTQCRTVPGTNGGNFENVALMPRYMDVCVCVCVRAVCFVMKCVQRIVVLNGFTFLLSLFGMFVPTNKTFIFLLHPLLIFCPIH